MAREAPLALLARATDLGQMARYRRARAPRFKVVFAATDELDEDELFTDASMTTAIRCSARCAT